VCCLTGTPTRLKELRAACKILGAKVVVEEGEDFSLGVRETSDRLVPLIQKIKPDTVISHSSLDYHPDHVTVHKAVLRAVEWAGHATLEKDKAWRPSRLLLMEINNLFPAPTLLVDISTIVDLKRRAIIAFRSQMAKTEGYYLSFSLQKARLRGLQAGCEFAEAFIEVPLPFHGPFYTPPPKRSTVFSQV
jgi:LmbE family N-acetylglucosaminyl deacetylase